MSHSYGEVWSIDGKLRGHFEYNGTSDIVCTRVHLKEQGVADNWRQDNWRDCKCGSAGERVILWTSYGFGFYWPGAVCWNCMAVTEGVNQYDDSEGEIPRRDGHPFFDQQMIEEYGRILPCPKCKAQALASDGDKDPIICKACGAGFSEWQIAPKEIDVPDVIGVGGV